MPHYVAVVPNPKGALALLRKLETLVGVTVDATELESSAVDYERQVSRAVEMDPDVQAFVERLERAADEEERDAGPERAPVRRPAGARVPAVPAPARRGPALSRRRLELRGERDAHPRAHPHAARRTRSITGTPPA